MADISIDEAKVKIWMDDVNAELDAVEVILKNVNMSLTTVAGEDDSIMNGIYNVGKAMETAWTTMSKNFKNAQSKIWKAIAKIVSSAQSVIEDTNTLKSKIGQ